MQNSVTMLRYENLKKPSSKRWKAVADFFLYSLPLYLGSIMLLPLDENLKMWLNFAVSILVISLKGISKFTSDES